MRAEIIIHIPETTADPNDEIVTALLCLALKLKSEPNEEFGDGTGPDGNNYLNLKFRDPNCEGTMTVYEGEEA